MNAKKLLINRNGNSFLKPNFVSDSNTRNDIMKIIYIKKSSLKSLQQKKKCAFEIE